ncbi:MAG: prepilin-type N-terminal cleavage/methylation domain-containing protein, partial [Candidatus Komeilibacteria bacterium]|nr:prepilin-type N-terminal cleavage/methylation domain-containing protein [Candidatus Komeilibacteria bacterium]
MFNCLKHKINFGFTLIELLVVISIIGVLAGLVLINLAGVRERVRDTQRKSELNEVKKALRLYYNDSSRYPASLNLTTGTAFTSSASASMVYMKQLPVDPLSPTQQYAYYQDQSSCPNGNNDFRLVAMLENVSDPDIAKSALRCGSGCDFDVTSGTKYYVVCPD